MENSQEIMEKRDEKMEKIKFFKKIECSAHTAGLTKKIVLIYIYEDGSVKVSCLGINKDGLCKFHGAAQQDFPCPYKHPK